MRNPAYIMVMNNENELPSQIISQEMSGFGYAPWNQEVYAQVLEFFWKDFGVSYQDIYKGDNKVWTLLWKEDGSFIKIKERKEKD